MTALVSRIIYVAEPCNAEDLESVSKCISDYSDIGVEIIIVHNAPQDRSTRRHLRNLNEMSPKIHLIETSSYLPRGAAWNLGINQARGRYVFFSRLSDSYSHDFFLVLSDCFTSNPDVQSFIFQPYESNPESPEFGISTDVLYTLFVLRFFFSLPLGSCVFRLDIDRKRFSFRSQAHHGCEYQFLLDVLHPSFSKVIPKCLHSIDKSRLVRSFDEVQGELDVSIKALFSLGVLKERELIYLSAYRHEFFEYRKFLIEDQLLRLVDKFCDYYEIFDDRREKLKARVAIDCRLRGIGSGDRASSSTL